VNSLLFTESAAVLPNHTYFLTTQTCVLDRHAEERVFVVLVIGGKGVLVEQDQFRIRLNRCRLYLLSAKNTRYNPDSALPDFSDVSIQQVAGRCRGPLKCTSLNRVSILLLFQVP
jgi:hypothetical protein